MQFQWDVNFTISHVCGLSWNTRFSPLPLYEVHFWKHGPLLYKKNICWLLNFKFCIEPNGNEGFIVDESEHGTDTASVSCVHARTRILLLSVVQTRELKCRVVNTPRVTKEMLRGWTQRSVTPQPIFALLWMLHCLLHCITPRIAKEILIM